MNELSLEIVEGPQAGRRVSLTGSLTVGREDGVDLRLDDELVSRRHARITPDAEGAGAVVEDLESRNGTFVNDAEIHTPTSVRPGEEILVGVTVLELRTAAQVAIRPTAVRPKPPPLSAAQRPADFVPPVTAAPSTSQIDPLLDIHVKAKARTAPLAIFVLVVFAVLIFLALRR